jgi:hypothetical protein
MDVIKSKLGEKTYLVTPSEETKDSMKFDQNLIKESFKIIGIVI